MILSTFLRFIAAINNSIRLTIWNSFYKESNIISLEILKDTYVKFYAYGDIVRIFYSQQAIVKHKKSFEYDTLEKYINFLTPDSIVLDIGANIGLYSLLGSKFLTGKGTIYAIEPTTKTYSFLKKNISLNDIKNVIPFKLAFSNKKSLVSMTPPQKALNNNFQDSFNQIQSVTGLENKSDIIETSLLDDFINEQNISKVDLIKIDVEGAELLCFQGGLQLLNSDNKPMIIFECDENHCKSFGYRVVEVLLLLEKYGYDCIQSEYGQWIATPKNRC